MMLRSFCLISLSGCISILTIRLKYFLGNFGTGNFGTGIFGTGIFGTGIFGTGIFGTGIFGTGIFGTGNFGTGIFGTGNFGTAIFGTGIFGTAIFGTGNFGTGNFGTGIFGTGIFGTGNFGTGIFGTEKKPKSFYKYELLPSVVYIWWACLKAHHIYKRLTILGWKIVTALPSAMRYNIKLHINTVGANGRSPVGKM